MVCQYGHNWRCAGFLDEKIHHEHCAYAVTDRTAAQTGGWRHAGGKSRTTSLHDHPGQTSHGKAGGAGGAICHKRQGHCDHCHMTVCRARTCPRQMCVHVCPANILLLVLDIVPAWRGGCLGAETRMFRCIDLKPFNGCRRCI